MGKVVPFPKRRWNWPGIVVSVLAIYLLYSFAHVGLALYQTNLQIKACQEQKAALLAEGNRLREQIKELNNDSYIERMAREELGLVKPGETVIIPAVPGQVRPYIPPQPGHEFRD
ncbi:Septum formation initiator [Moorella glycerini]|uniref:Cell division protein FtsL n=3 Tax=Neomoorella TaxID=44260 RepID=A0A9X7IZR1_9FIRM|nr:MULTISPECIES: septum formation initiator family protein [Moorella]KYH33861.1 cell division protein FtsL [Moorella mulderi DSM 14980]PRR68544.1 Cell division protein FtsL [Moorella stamsii]QGP92086.1 Cell division protein FtsL [Moorella glycerini]CEP66519.1 Septum formation initiator [Moorella glycerini]